MSTLTLMVLAGCGSSNSQAGDPVGSGGVSGQDAGPSDAGNGMIDPVGGAGGAAGGSTGSKSGAAPARMTGTFDITWTTLMAPGLSFTIAGRDIVLTLRDDGPDETNYSATGTATISPTVVAYAGTTCSLASEGDATKAWTEKQWFKVLKPFSPRTTYAQRWGWSEMWTYQCAAGGFLGVTVNFMTKTGANCTQFADVPASNGTALNGSFDMTCMAASTGNATWSFAP